MGLVKTRRLAAMQKQQRAKAAMKPPMRGGGYSDIPNTKKNIVAVKAKPECCSEQNRNVEYTMLHETAKIRVGTHPAQPL